ncbi:hypothetical protein [Streptomyces sp. NPDC051636]|uniref:hypothetical protein n=1 Tax=Streptomyces sp. NPDC051636 TaxID=3365663 RepID=UPI0037939346
MSSQEERDQQLALLCEELPRLRVLHRGPVGAAGRRVMDRAVRAARAGEPIGEYLDTLGLRTGPTVDRAAPAQRGPALPTPVADAAPRALFGAHVCPRGVCTRREQRPADAERPVCEVFDLALRFDPES